MLKYLVPRHLVDHVKDQSRQIDLLLERMAVLEEAVGIAQPERARRTFDRAARRRS